MSKIRKQTKSKDILLKLAESENTETNEKPFLSELNNINYFGKTETNTEIKTEITEEIPKVEEPLKLEVVKPINENKRSKMTKIIDKLEKQKNKINKDDNLNDSIFSESGSEILGKDKRLLIAKVHQYKNLFPEQLKSFKVKKNASIEELQEYLEEIDVIVSTDNIEQFLTDGILQSLKAIESVSTYSKYDISGLTDLLKSNKQFDTLMKQLYIKYKVFSQVPPEYSAVVLISTTAWICMMKNKGKKELEIYLNQPVSFDSNVIKE